jgi:Aspartyl protease
MRTRHRPPRTLLVLGLLAAGGASAETPQPVAVPVQRSHTVLLVVAARINGAGPYKLVLDTGTNISLLETSLFHELGLQQQGTLNAKVVNGMRLGSLGVAHEVSLDGGLSQKDVAILEVDGVKRPDLGSSVRGVLGENFLGAFDLLIDNRRHQVVFDSGGTLASLLSGEQLPLSLSATVHGAKVPNRPLIAASIISSAPDRPLQLLVDTASEGAYLLPRAGYTPQRPAATSARSSQFTLLDGATPCARWTGQLQLGKITTRKIKLTSCGEPATSDHDGTLPTFLFDRVFISHSHGYLILNPATAR